MSPTPSGRLRPDDGGEPKGLAKNELFSGVAIGSNKVHVLLI